jgi:hypothetical protein
LKHRCLKWACITHLDIWNTSYGQKKGQELNFQFDSQPLKVGNFPDSLMCKWHVTYCWKSLDKGYNFASYVIPIKGFHTKLWVSKVLGVPILGILGLQLAIWLLTTKSWKSTWLLHVQATFDIPLESSRQGLQLFFRPCLNRRFSCKVMGAQIVEVLVVGISRLPSGSPETKKPFGCDPRGKVHSIL